MRALLVKATHGERELGYALAAELIGRLLATRGAAGISVAAGPGTCWRSCWLSTSCGPLA